MAINKKISFVDTNVLISFFIQDKNFNKVKEIFKNEVYLNNFVLAELLNFIQNKFDVQKSYKVTSFILNEPEFFTILPIEPLLYAQACKLMLKFLDSELSFVDCLILKQSEVNDLTVYTMDERMASYKKVNVVNPVYV